MTGKGGTQTMTYQKWLALTGVVLLHGALWGALAVTGWASPGRHPNAAWLFLSVPYVGAGVLGFWLAAGGSKPWLRMMVCLVGVSGTLAMLVSVTQFHPLVLAPSLAATTAFSALTTLALGCLGGVVPRWSVWQVRFALWEIIAATGLVAVCLAAWRIASRGGLLNWNEWLGAEGAEFLTFACVSGVFVPLCALPLLFRVSIWGRLLGLGLLGVVWVILPSVEQWLFLLSNRGASLDILYGAHLGQLVIGVPTFLLLGYAVPGFVRTAAAPQEAPSPGGDSGGTEF